jgi:hypothetical protein
MNPLLIHAFYDLFIAVGLYGISFLVETPILRGIGPTTARLAVGACRFMAVILTLAAIIWFLLYLFW